MRRSEKTNHPRADNSRAILVQRHLGRAAYMSRQSLTPFAQHDTPSMRGNDGSD